ncbi:MAG TPA: class I SAM-dependent methyltransferase [Mycobacteriales bacterium]|nr:class I SAM-dependent methyltransferase [Mycobacteriales bacterium]
MTGSYRLERSRSFGANAELYDRLRPGYPRRALDALLPEDARRVADVGAGTGKLTAALLARGLEVVAVEPDDAMRAVLISRIPEADIRAGQAEALPLQDASVDAVLFAQSWHWVDSERGAGEAARVLRGDGTLAMLWNLYDDRVPWVGQLAHITAGDAGVSEHEDTPSVTGFGPGSRVDVPWRQDLTPDQLVELVRTWSTVSTRSAAERDDVLSAVRELLSGHPAVAGRARIGLPHTCSTRAYRRLTND